VTERIKTYASGTIAVRFSARRCIHAAQCVFGLPRVFDPERRPWIEPQLAEAEAIARVVALCPTGALHFDRLDGGAAEQPDAVNRVRVARNVRVALCRCGASRNRPFCDNSHRAIRFVDPGDVFEGGVRPGNGAGGPELRVTTDPRGPHTLEGPLELESADGLVRLTGGRTTLCGCGASRNKPFCDGSHHDEDLTGT
jgi:CDGSH-type Zn-finger protein/uncharacterized Fe-S cluster protein YjdI